MLLTIVFFSFLKNIFVVVGIEPRALSMLGKWSTTKLHLRPQYCFEGSRLGSVSKKK
jgi:hypothetical protein